MTSFGYQTRLGFQLVTATRSGRKELYVRLFLSANYCRLTSKAHANSFLFNLVKTGAGFSRTTTCARGGPQKWKFGGRPDANGGSHDARPATPSSASQSQSTDDGSQVPRRPNKKKSDAPASTETGESETAGKARRFWRIFPNPMARDWGTAGCTALSNFVNEVPTSFKSTAAAVGGRRRHRKKGEMSGKKRPAK